jgi:hypothetical protein
MTKAALVVLAGTESGDGLGRVVNAMITAKELKESGDEVALLFDGAGTKWVATLSEREHRYTACSKTSATASPAPAPNAPTPSGSASR